MARKSRKKIGGEQAVLASCTIEANQTGIYVRLSVEDNKCRDGDSLQNQISYLREYVEMREEFQLVQIYTDNGTTGTNFERDGWQHLIDDIRAGKINCVVVKDFSRIGRNYIEVGNYLEKIFPFLGIRVVAVNDNFDSKKQSFENSMLMNSLTNIVNEYYARDISRKIQQTNEIMRKNGEYASGVYPYGYKRSEENRRKLAVDREAAIHVKQIFEWRSQGKSCNWIADHLNAEGVPSPGRYRFLNGEKSFAKCSQSKWKAELVATILKNPVYLGHMVQGKSTSSHFRNGGRVKRIPREKWVVVENTQEAIVTLEQYAVAQEMAEKGRNGYQERMEANAGVSREDNLLRQKIYCGKCGRRMFRRSKVGKGIRNYYYYCDSGRRILDMECAQASFHEDFLMGIIKEVAKKHLQLLGDFISRWEERRMLKKNRDCNKDSAVLEKKALEQEIAVLKKRKRELYADRKEGMLTLADFESEWKNLSQQIATCEEERASLDEKADRASELAEILKEYPNDVFCLQKDAIPIALLDVLIEKVVIVSKEQIEVWFTYADILDKEDAENAGRLCRGISSDIG